MAIALDNKLSVLVKESGLESSKGEVLLNNFQEYFKLAGEWEIKAKAIQVTKADQTAEMKMARVGRLFLREKRISIEKTRKQLKEQSIREGKAIDGIANVLKALIVPIEEHLNKQEKFIEIRAAEEAEKKRIADEKEAERILLEEEAERKRVAAEEAKKQKEAEVALEKEREEERDRMRKENERVKAGAEEKERIAQEKLKEAKAEQEAEKKRNDEKMEQIKAERAEEKKKSEAELKAVIEKNERMVANQTGSTANRNGEVQTVQCPECGNMFDITK